MMSRKEKLYLKLRNHPKDVTFDDLMKLLNMVGFELKRITDSHHVFSKGKITFIIPVHKKRVKTVYVKRVIDLIESNIKKGES